MSLLKPLTMTPARLAANRRNAQRSTGPRTERGKAQSRLNRLQSGGRSSTCGRLLNALLQAAPGAVHETAAALLTPVELAHPKFVALIEDFQKGQEFALELGPRFLQFWADLRKRMRMARRKKRKTLKATKSNRIREVLDQAQYVDDNKPS